MHIDLFLLCSPAPLLILLPVALCGIIRVYRSANQVFVQKRGFRCTIGLCLALCSAMVLSYLFPVTFNSRRIISDVCLSALAVLFFLVLFFLNVRSWLIFYNYHYSFYTAQSGWRKIINPAVAIDDEQNWFVLNMHKYGNPCYVRKTMLVAHLLGAAALSAGGIIRFQMTENTKHETHVSLGLAAACFVAIAFFIAMYAVIVCKTPSFDDSHFIHWESAIHARLSTLMLLISLSTPVAGAFVHISTARFAFFQCHGLYFFAMIFVSTYAVISKNNRTSKDSNNSSLSVSITLKEILEDEFVFAQFMQHLFTEYSTECLLSFIEFSQYEQYILDCLHAVGENTKETPQIEMLKMHLNVPQSAIVDATNRNSSVSDSEERMATDSAVKQLSEIKAKAHRLFKKYVEVDCALEINISSKLRRRMTDAFGDASRLLEHEISLLQILALFEGARHQMHTLLGHSVCNFHAKPEFKTVRKYLRERVSV